MPAFAAARRVITIKPPGLSAPGIVATIDGRAVATLDGKIVGVKL